MPRQKRWAIKQTLEQAHLAVVKAQNYLVLTGKDFDEVHPDYYVAFSSIVQSLEKVKSAINDMIELI